MTLLWVTEHIVIRRLLDIHIQNTAPDLSIHNP